MSRTDSVEETTCGATTVTQQGLQAKWRAQGEAEAAKGNGQLEQISEGIDSFLKYCQ